MYRRHAPREEETDDMDLEYGTNGTNGRITAFLVGSLAGGVAALLLAPTSGRRLRRSLARKGRRIKRRASDSVTTLRERGETVMDKASDSLEDIAREARQMAGRLARL